MLLTALHEVVEAAAALAEAAETGVEAVEAAQAIQAMEGAEAFSHQLEALEAAADAELAGRLRPENLIVRNRMEPARRLVLATETGDLLDLEDALDSEDIMDGMEDLRETDEALKLIQQGNKWPRMRLSVSSVCSGLESMRAGALQSAAGWKRLEALGAESAARAESLREEAAALLEEAEDVERSGKLFGMLDYPEWGVKDVQEAQYRRG